MQWGLILVNSHTCGVNMNNLKAYTYGFADRYGYLETITVISNSEKEALNAVLNHLNDNDSVIRITEDDLIGPTVTGHLINNVFTL
jgi:hypothetical protein